jgi:hypothetical protein
VNIRLDQMTDMAPEDVRNSLARILCHLIVDRLPSNAYVELLPTLSEMFEYYSSLSPMDAPSITAAKPLMLVSRKIRPEVELDEA